MNKNIILLACFISFNSVAGEIDSNNITTFTSGTVISSSSVNTSVSEIVTQINDNAQRINALESSLIAATLHTSILSQHIENLINGTSVPIAHTFSGLTLTEVPEIYGSWILNDNSNKLVFANGYYLLCRINSSTLNCIPDNIDMGTYSYNAGTGTVTITSDIIDCTGNGGCGWTINETLPTSVNNNILTLNLSPTDILIFNRN